MATERGAGAIAAWRGLADRHFRPGAPPVAWARVAGSARAELGAWLEATCGGSAGGFCGSFVAAGAAGMRAHRTELVARGGTRVTLFALSAPGRAMADLAFASGIVLPVLVAGVGLLNEAAGEPRAAVWAAFVPLQDRRALPDAAGAPVGPDHLNGGLTSHAGGGRILVYRSEDAAKVMLHELIHLYRLEERLGISAGDEARVAAAARVVPRGPVPVLGLNECFVDTLACFLHAAWVARSRGASERATLARVGEHLVSTAARLLAHYGRGAPLRGRAALVEGTHSYAYIVCKAAVWHRGLPEFLERFGFGAGPRRRAAARPGEFAAYVESSLAAPAFARAVRRAAAGAARGLPSRSLRMVPTV